MGAQTDPVPWGVPASCQSNDGRSAVWASFRVDQAGPVTIDLDGSDFDTIIVLYDGFGNKIACNDDDPTNDPGDFTSRIANELVGSTSLYLVRITGWNGTFSSVGTTELACDNDAGDGTKARVIVAMQADRYYYVRVATLSSASS